MVRAMEVIMGGRGHRSPDRGFYYGLAHERGDRGREITVVAKVTRGRSRPASPWAGNLVDLDRDEINVDWETIVDTCGTGGDYGYPPTVSTTTAFVVAGAGLRVAKHGNRAELPAAAAPTSSKLWGSI